MQLIADERNKNGKVGDVSAKNRPIRSLRQKRGDGVGRRDTREGREWEWECHRIMVGAEMVKGETFRVH